MLLECACVVVAPMHGEPLAWVDDAGVKYTVVNNPAADIIDMVSTADGMAASSCSSHSQCSLPPALEAELIAVLGAPRQHASSAVHSRTGEASSQAGSSPALVDVQTPGPLDGSADLSAPQTTSATDQDGLQVVMLLHCLWTR